MTDLVKSARGKGADLVPPSLDKAREFVRKSKAESTLRGYRTDWRDFCTWCESHGVGPLPAAPESVASYIAECAGRLKVGSIQRRLNAIAEAHKVLTMESPTAAGIVRATLKGIKRTVGTAPAQKTDEEIQQHCDDCGLGKWAWAACQGANCTGDGVIEDTFDALCRWCSCKEERPTDPADMPPPMSAEAEEWTAWFYRFHLGESPQRRRAEHTCSGLPN